MSEIPHQDSQIAPAAEGPPPKRNIKRVIYTSLLVVGGLVVLAALLLPAVRIAREPARRNACQNKMKQLAVAIQNYVDIHGELPPAHTTDENGKPLHSWRTLILPYLEESKLYESIDLTKPWDDPVNAEAFKTHLEAYDCPSRQGSDNLTTYLAVVAPGSCLQPGESSKFADITDPTNETITIIEVDAAHAVPWMQPVDAGEATMLAINDGSALDHTSGMHAAFADGTVHYLPADMSAAARRAMISIAGGDSDILRKEAGW